MAKWEEINLDDIPNFRESHRGRVSYPLMKSFLETGLSVSRLDRTGLQQSLQTLTSCLNTYIKNHNLPIKIFQRRGEIFAARTDTNNEGLPNPQYNDIHHVPRQGQLLPTDVDPQQQQQQEEEEEASAPIIDDNEVDLRYGIDKNLTTR